jgi:hypothetical protein
MAGLVGVKNAFDVLLASEDVSSRFKQEALLLDKIAFHGFELVTEAESVSKELLSEFLWLQEQGIIFIPPAPKDRRKTRLSKAYKQYRQGSENLIELVNELEAKRKTDEQIKMLYEMVIIAHQLDTRALCLYLREVNHMDACWSFSHSCHEYFSEASPRAVLEIILPKMPVPSVNTSWEQIIEFRNDPDSQSKFLALREWMNDVVRNKLSLIEVEQKADYLIDQYKQQIKLHKMKTNPGFFQTMIVSGSEAIENLVTAKWGKLSKQLFSFRQRQIDLLETELKATGRELAYVVKANERFRS